MTSLRLSDAHPVEWQTARCGRTLDIRPGEHVGPESGHLAGSGSRTSIANCVRQAGHSRTVSGCSGNAAGSSASSTRRPLTSPPPGAPHRPSPQLQPAHNVAGVERPGSATTGARTWPLLRSLPLVIDRSVATVGGLLEVDRTALQGNAMRTGSGLSASRPCNHRAQRGSA